MPSSLVITAGAWGWDKYGIERLKQLSADPDAPPENAKRVGGLAPVKSNRNLFTWIDDLLEC